MFSYRLLFYGMMIFLFKHSTDNQHLKKPQPIDTITGSFFGTQIGLYLSNETLNKIRNVKTEKRYE